MRQDRAGDHGRIDIRVLLHIVRIHIPMELRELGPVQVTVAGRVTEDDGIPVQLAPAAQTVVTVGVVAAPFAVVPVLVLLQVVSVVLRLHHGVVHLGTGNIQSCHGVGILRSGFRQLCLPVHRGITSPARVADG